MAVTTMPSIASLINKLQTDYPQYTFVPANTFYWSPSEQTIYFDPKTGDTASLLHEVAHGVLGHASYNADMELLGMERDAWEHARHVLASQYDVVIGEEIAEDSLDSYRDWLHARSICPSCQATGIQKKKYLYTCLACGNQWKVNEARVCALRRYKISN